jgi:hypothetical protein
MTGEKTQKVDSLSGSGLGFSNPKNLTSEVATKLQTSPLDETQPMEPPDIQLAKDHARSTNNSGGGSSGANPGFQATPDAQSADARMAEIQAAEQSLDRRRLDLDRQTQLLAARLQQVFEREQRLAGLEVEKRQLDEEKKNLQNCRAELDNLKEIMDLEFTRNRKLLVQERLQIARMREALRLDHEKLQAERDRTRKT